MLPRQSPGLLPRRCPGPGSGRARPCHLDAETELESRHAICCRGALAIARAPGPPGETAAKERQGKVRYIEPESIEEAVSLLAGDPGARCMGGGAVLVARMNAGEPAPDALVSLRQIPSLAGIEDIDGGVRIGAMTVHATVAADQRLAGAMAVVRSAAGQIALPPVRNMATIGGTIALGSSGSDLSPALVAARAEVEVSGPAGARTMPIEEVFVGYGVTSLAPAEIVTGVRLPRGPAGAVGHHLRVARAHGDYAIASLSLVLAMDGDTCSYARVALGTCGPVPVRAPAAEDRLVGSQLGDQDLAEAGQMLVDASAPVDDLRASAAYRRTIIPRMLARAVAIAQERASV